METQFDISKLIKSGKIQNELDLERALIADRKLRVLSKKDLKFKSLRTKLRDLIEQYESKNWSDESKFSDEKLHESNTAESIAEKERLFFLRRKELIREKLKKLDLTQQDFGRILGHQSKSYTSELINGLSPFSLKDLIVINQVFSIDLIDLIPAFLTQVDKNKIRTSIKKLNNPKLKLDTGNLALVE